MPGVGTFDSFSSWNLISGVRSCAKHGGVFWHDGNSKDDELVVLGVQLLGLGYEEPT